MRKYWQEISILVIIFIIAAIPRMADLGTFLTADEKNWIGRSHEFIQAFADGRFNDMLQTTHPGVTTLWVTGAAIAVQTLVSGIPFSFENLVHFVKISQLPIALLNSLAVPVMYLFLRKLFSSRFLPLVAALIIALNPFIIGYSRVVHVDALLMSWLFLAALATMVWAKEGYRRRWLVISAVLSGLAILTKAPAVFLVPWLVLVMLVYGGQRWRARLRDFGLWLLMIVVMIVVLWPAVLFVPDPKGNALLVKRDLSIAAATPHHMVEDYTLNSSHYLFTLLTRTTPVTLVFGSFAVLWLLLKIPMTKSQIPNKLQISNDQKRVLWLLIAFVFFFIVMMTLGAKKGDRYILPVFPALDVLAVFGIGLFGKKLRPILAGAAVVYLAVVVWNYHPYAIAYSNPLFPDNLSQSLGWGEGLEQVGKWLSENHPEAVVASWYPEELGAYTSARVAHINAHEQGKVQLVVLYRNMFGRAQDHYANNFIDEYYKKREPVFVVEVAGKEFAWVYEKKTYSHHVGELLPGEVVKREVMPSNLPIAGVDIMAATFSGQATKGVIVVSLNDFTWRIPVSELSDTGWTTLRLPDLKLADNVTVAISTEGTFTGNAPTIRFNQETNEAAIRLRYVTGDNQEASEEDTKLLRF